MCENCWAENPNIGGILIYWDLAPFSMLTQTPPIFFYVTSLLTTLGNINVGLIFKENQQEIRGPILLL